MTTATDVDLLLDRWLADGATELSDRVLDTALDIVEHTPQRRVLRLPWRNQSMLISMRLAAAAALVVVVALGGAYVLRSTSTEVAQSPGPSVTSSLAPSPTAHATATPGPTPTLIPGTSLATGPTKLVAGKTYSTGQFDPAFALKGQANWWYLDGGPGSAWFVQGPNEPNGPDTYEFGIAVAAHVIPPPGSTANEDVPSDLVAWLQSRPDLRLGSPQPVTVGAVHGTALQGTVNTAVTLNAGVNLVCPAETHPCAQDQGGAVGFGASGAFEIIVIKVNGQFLVIGLQGPSASWAANAKVLDPMLAGLSFPGLSN